MKELSEFEESEEYIENLRYRDWCKTPEGRAKLASLRPKKQRRPSHSAKCSFCDSVWFMVKNNIRYCEKCAKEKEVDRCYLTNLPAFLHRS
jgi:hypothetical protein